jgi:hypothetical protein
MRRFVRAKPFVTPMLRGRLPARSCRHARVDGPDRPSGRNALQAGSPHQPSCRRPGADPGPRTEIRLGARAHTTRITNRAHAPPAPPSLHPRPLRIRRLPTGPCTDKERGSAPSKPCPPGVRFRSSEGTRVMIVLDADMPKRSHTSPLSPRPFDAVKALGANRSGLSRGSPIESSPEGGTDSR